MRAKCCDDLHESNFHGGHQRCDDLHESNFHVEHLHGGQQRCGPDPARAEGTDPGPGSRLGHQAAGSYIILLIMTYIATCNYILYILSGDLHDRDAIGRAPPQTHAHLPPEGH